MTDTPNLFVTRVVRTERLNGHFQRVVVTGEHVHLFPDNGFTDRYVKLLFPPAGVRYTADTDARSLPPEQRPTYRTYTIRRIDRAANELTIDFVLHGDHGVAGPWAAAAMPGDELFMSGPGGAYAPDLDADVHLLVGDEAALPAIASALEALVPAARAIVIVEVDDATDHLDLASDGEVDLRWLYRADGGGDRALLDAVRAVDWPAGRVDAFVHGELHLTRAIGAHLIEDRGLDRSAMSISGYWRRGKDEDGFQAEKRELAAAARASG